MTNLHNETETWKDIQGFEGLYQVSNLGKVQSLDRRVKGRLPNTQMDLKGLIKKCYEYKGYIQTTFCKNGVTSTHLIHRLVAQAFIPNPENKREVNHINLIKSDNRAVNLEWATPSENMKHAFRNGVIKIPYLGKKGKDHICSKKVAQYDLSGVLIRVFDAQIEAERETGICRGNIVAVCNGKKRTAGGFRWKHYS